MKLEELNLQPATTPLELVYHDPQFRYDGYGNRLAFCELHVFAAPDEPWNLVAIATELRENPGTSITNAIENVYKAVLQAVPSKVSSHKRLLTLFEHYLGDSVCEEHYDLVCLSSTSSPSWRRVGMEEMTRLLGHNKIELSEAS